MPDESVAVIGAGVAGLAAAVELAGDGLDVTVFERAHAPGGKMREIAIGDARIDGGPTVLTMRWVFDELFADAGASFEEALGLEPVEVIARHAWSAEERLDLFSDVDRTADAVGALAGPAEARGYRRFSERAQSVYETLETSFIRARRASPATLMRAAGLRGALDLWRIRPFATLWRALGDYFADPRLRQLFGRYATYVGSSPFEAPATLMLIAHVEREGVWLVQGGMHQLAVALARLAESRGARVRFGSEVREITAPRGRVAEVVLTTGERVPVDAVVSNTDVAALSRGCLGAEVATAVPASVATPRSLSAITWARLAETSGFPLVRHNVFFSHDYRTEFDDVFGRARLPRAPTVYVCAQDRDGDGRGGDAAERLLCLVNAPATGDSGRPGEQEIRTCEEQAFALLRRCGLEMDADRASDVVTTPTDFEGLFPASGGALYGAACHGWRATFRRPGARSAIPGLYLASGGTHPGPGVPMAALAGRAAAASLREDLASGRRSRATATPGGTSTP